MTLASRDKRALLLLGVATAFSLTVWFWPENQGGGAAKTVSAGDIPLAERRLQRLRQLAATAPAREAALKQALADLSLREKGIIQADTAAQAQAQILQIVRRLARGQAPPLELSGVEMGPVRPLGNDYGEAVVSVTFTARIDQLLNLLADITAQPELVSTQELRVGAPGNKQKTMNVRLTFSGVVPRKLVPEKKGFAF
jgi:hypothetical protein